MILENLQSKHGANHFGDVLALKVSFIRKEGSRVGPLSDCYMYEREKNPRSGGATTTYLGY